MEDVLDVYHAPYDPKRPVMCLDETTQQLLSDTRATLATQPGRVTRYDYEYERHGTRNLWLCFEPWRGWRHVDVTMQRTTADWAYCIRALVDQWYPEAEGLRLVRDNLNTHHLASLYEAFAPAAARRLAQKLEIHYTPKHGSWLNMAAIEFSALARQCLDGRIADEPHLVSAVAAWEPQRNAQHTTVHWQLTTAEARIKLTQLYPSL